jgi:hypothetical protein
MGWAPYYRCDVCQTRYDLPGNCAYGFGFRFLRPELKKRGLTLKGPHICPNCRKTQLV